MTVYYMTVKAVMLKI